MVSIYGFILKVTFSYVSGVGKQWRDRIRMTDQGDSDLAVAARAYDEIRQLRRKARLYHEILQGGEGGDPEGRAQAAFQEVVTRLLGCLFAFSEDGHEDRIAALLATQAGDGKGR